MITLSAKLDATKQAHGRVTTLDIFKHEWIEIFHRNPTEYSSGFFYIVSTPTYQLSNQIGEGFLVFLSNTNSSGVNFCKFVRIPEKLREIEVYVKIGFFLKFPWNQRLQQQRGKLMISLIVTTQILCEIKFGWFQKVKICHFNNFEGFELWFLEFHTWNSQKFKKI